MGRGGSWEGKDLDKLGLKGRGQGKAQKRLELDDFYEKAKKEGRLDSASIFGGANLPWTAKEANKLNNKGKVSKKPSAVGTQANAAGRKLSSSEFAARKQELAKVSLNSPKLQKPRQLLVERRRKDFLVCSEPIVSLVCYFKNVLMIVLCVTNNNWCVKCI